MVCKFADAKRTTFLVVQRRRMLRSVVGWVRVHKGCSNSHRIHGNGIFPYMKTIKRTVAIHVGKYIVYGSVMGYTGLGRSSLPITVPDRNPLTCGGDGFCQLDVDL